MEYINNIMFFTFQMASRPDDVIFEHELDMKYICPICLTVFWNPIQTACGHRFCKQCIAGVIRLRNIYIHL